MINELKESLNNVIKGKSLETENILTFFLAGGHVLIQDAPGVGKTTLAKTLALSISCEFKRIQFTPDLLPADILGGSIYNASNGQFQFKKGPIFANIVLADEINRASPRTQSSLLEAMSEEQVSIEGNTYSLDRPFLVLATQNPSDFHGTYPLPEAQMDRFMACIQLGYPSPEAELDLLVSQKTIHPLSNTKKITTGKEVVEIQDKIKEIHIEENILRYIVNLVNLSREDSDVELGLSPRASLAMMRCAQAKAYLAKRDHVLPDDIKYLSPFIFSHRLILKNKLNSTQEEKEDVIYRLLEKTPVPN